MRASAEDKIIGQLFQTFFNVTGVDTRDDRGAHRYHQGGVKQVSDWPIEKGGHQMRIAIHLNSMDASLRWRGVPVVFHDDLVSSSSVAFHLAQADTMRRYEMLLYGTGVDLCQNSTTSL
jgi:hypothetical protein